MSMKTKIHSQPFEIETGNKIFSKTKTTNRETGNVTTLSELL